MFSMVCKGRKLGVCGGGWILRERGLVAKGFALRCTLSRMTSEEQTRKASEDSVV